VRAAVFATTAAPKGIRVLTWPVLWRMPRYAPAILRSRSFTIGPDDAAALLGNRMTPGLQAWAYPQLVAESGRAAREMALGGVAVDPAGIRCPTLVVGAQHDRITPTSVERQIAAPYGSEYLEARGHAHMLMLEEGWEVPFREILAWLDRVV
jgi:pimeloyl-ACP methyl ester carboxylesterase